MADFLIDLAQSGRFVVAETHSENFLLRIRRRMVGGDGKHPPLERDHVSIIVVSARRNGSSVANPLELDAMGQVKDWPMGFMEEATEERMAILKGMARRSPGGSNQGAGRNRD
jgi:predicted ATPase